MSSSRHLQPLSITLLFHPLRLENPPFVGENLFLPHACDCTLHTHFRCCLRLNLKMATILPTRSKQMYLPFQDCSVEWGTTPLGGSNAHPSRHAGGNVFVLFSSSLKKMLSADNNLKLLLFKNPLWNVWRVFRHTSPPD